MKKLLLLSVLFFSLSLTVSAQQTVKIWKGGICLTFTTNDVDSIVFSEGDNPQPVDPYNGHEYVDLGLPSGLKWATCNVGAAAPEDYGDYYAWGETETKEVYNWSTYKWCNGDYNKMTKYCNNSSYGNNGFTDNKTVLDPEDDVAHVKWGGNWRMPTDAEFTELRTNCTWTWTTSAGVYGRKVVGPNGNSIFLPAAGYRYFSGLGRAGSNGYYWSSSLYPSNSYYAYRVSFYSGSVYRYRIYRYYGRSVRPVCQ